MTTHYLPQHSDVPCGAKGGLTVGVTRRPDKVDCVTCQMSPEYAEALFVARHSVLTDADVAWARAQNEARNQ